jgi:hypothetical protein
LSGTRGSISSERAFDRGVLVGFFYYYRPELGYARLIGGGEFPFLAVMSFLTKTKC